MCLRTGPTVQLRVNTRCTLIEARRTRVTNSCWKDVVMWTVGCRVDHEATTSHTGRDVKGDTKRGLLEKSMLDK